MKKIKYYIFFLMSIIICACSENNIDEQTNTPVNKEESNIKYGRRTIIAYITGDNNITSSLSDDINEMIKGSISLSDDYRLIVMADIKFQKPYIASISKGKMTKIKEYSSDFYTTSPNSMHTVLQWIIEKYPSEEYALIMEGHGSGPLIRTDTVASSAPISLYAYGYDDMGYSSDTNTWMNVPSIASALTNLKDCKGNNIKMSYIFFDCCCFMTAEVTYELRNLTNYIIAPVSETPGEGADYTKMLTALCAPSNEVVEKIVTTYSNNSKLCIAGVRTDHISDLCNATRTALKKIYNGINPLILNRKKCIYYYKGTETGKITRVPALHDMKCIMKHNLSTEAFNEWLPYLERTVVAKHLSKRWETMSDINFYAFDDNLNNDCYGGISMIAPTDVYNEFMSDINTTMFQLQWCNAVGWHTFGW